MATTQKHAAVTASRFQGRWARLAPRLLAGFLLPILLTAATGVVAVQRFSALTATTTELTSLDLPEVFTVTHLHGLLYQQWHLARTGIESPAARTDLSRILAAQQADALSLEPLKAGGTNDAPLARTLVNGVSRNVALTRQVQGLRASGRGQQAQTLYRQQVAPLLDRMITVTRQLRSLEQEEATATATRAQQESSMATRAVLVLTVLSLAVSILAALVLTRSLTKPLAALLRATRDLASGNLEASPRIAAQDEVGQLAAAFDTMRSNLRATITDLHLERQRTQAIIDASSDGVILLDGEQRITQLNPAAARLSGWSAAQAVGEEWWRVFGCTPDAAAELVNGSVFPEPATQLELLTHDRNGDERWLAVSAAPVAWNGGSATRRTVLNFHDISDLKAIDRLKSDFVAMVSHELRAPLTTVTGAVEMLATVDPVQDTGWYRELVAILEQQTQRLRSVIEEVLQVTRLEAGQLPVRLAPVALVPFLQGVVASIREEWGDEGRQVSVQAPAGDAVVWADQGLLEIVIRNLIDNARKYTPQGSPVEIEVEARPAEEQVQMRVIDHGPGIPPDQIEHVFDRFARGVQSSYNWNRGYGLGLYIARQVVQAHSGTIWVENRPDGACFVISLCLMTPDEVGDPAPQRAAV